MFDDTLSQEGPASGILPARRAVSPRSNRPPFECIALLLQGGGALGSYQAGVYEALAEADLHPDWVAGISIGAINAAIIAGNAPTERVGKLRAFWEQITANPLLDWALAADAFGPKGDFARSIFNQMSAASGARRRRSRLFLPASACRLGCSRSGALEATSFYETEAPQGDPRAARRLRPDQCRRDALQRGRGQRAHRQFRLFRQHDAHDPARAHHGERRAAARLSGRRDRGRVLLGRRPHLEHAAAMGASITSPRQDTLAFQVDLWSARGELPRNLAEVVTRQKEIQYSSRTRANTDQFKRLQRLRSALASLLSRSCPTSCATARRRSS